MNWNNFNCLITLSELLNFTSAADALNMTQPALSKIVSSIEEEVGFQIFRRNKRNTVLTQAGRSFLEDIMKVMTIYNQSIAHSRSIDKGDTGVINIGYLGPVVRDLLPKIVNCFKKEYPNVQLHFHDGSQAQLMNYLQTERIDVALTSEVGVDRYTNLKETVLYEDPYSIAINSSHPLANNEFVTLSQLKEETFLLLARNDSVLDPPISNSAILTKACIKNDFIPNVMYGVGTLYNLLILVDCNVGVAMLAEHMQKYATENVKFLKIDKNEFFFRAVAVYKKDIINPCLPQFLEIVEQICDNPES